MTIEIPLKLPSLNEYIGAMNRNRYIGNGMKQKYQKQIEPYLSKLPKPFKNPVIIHFTWVENNKRRDLDNIAFAKKFILDALTKSGVLVDDNHNYVKGFSDDFKYEKEARIILNFEEVENG